MKCRAHSRGWLNGGWFYEAGGYSVTAALPLTPLPEFLSLQDLREARPLCQMPPDTDTGLSVGRPYISRVVQSIYTFSGTSESFHSRSCADMVSVALPGL